MTSIPNPLPAPSSRWARRLSHTWRTLFAPGDGLTVIVALGILLMPLFALAAAGWPLDLRTILPTTILSLLFGILLARSQYNELLSLVMSGIYGIGFVGLVAAINEPGGLGNGAVSVVTRVARWSVDAFTGGINQDEVVFTILVGILFWYLGYNTAWHLFRVDRVWRVTLPPGLILVTNSLYYAGDTNLDPYLVVFVFLALLLLARSNLDARTWEWYTNGIRVPRNLRRQFMRIGAVLIVIALLISGLIQVNDIQERLNRFQEFLQSEPLTQISEIWNRLFTSAETQGPTTSDYYGGDSLQLGGAIKLGEQTVFLVQVPQGRRYYWRSRVLDIYSSGRWSPGADIRLTVEQEPLEIKYEADNLQARVPVQQRFTMGLSASRLIYAAPQPYQINLPARVDLMYTPNREGMNISVIRPLKVLERGDAYTVTSLLSDASASQLRTVPSNYPDWILRLNLQLPPGLSEQTRQLAQQIVGEAGATTPYDRARAIEGWLRTNITYNEAIPQPPADRDPVEWVLFDIKQGYCNYYASAMVLMLRTLGIPARMVAGFAQGTWDAEQSAYSVQERDAHTWVEVYFPGYGWIEFEPTAAQAPLNRQDDVPLPALPTPTPAVSPTPTATPSPSPSPTVDPSTPQPQIAPQLPTLTPTPSPTATPIIVPTQAPPLTPQQPGLLSLLLGALGAALLVLFVVVLIVGAGVFTYWWWEWRGMRGMSPISRAYARLERYVRLIGIYFSHQQTPSERRAQVVRRIPKAEPPISAITDLYTAERYGPTAEDWDTQSDMADEAWSDTRSNILKRWLRRFIPFKRG
ncbi:MAG: transglutaminase domain-containing protein [Anaerolineae bacterium]